MTTKICYRHCFLSYVERFPCPVKWGLGLNHVDINNYLFPGKILKGSLIISSETGILRLYTPLW